MQLNSIDHIPLSSLQFVGYSRWCSMAVVILLLFELCSLSRLVECVPFGSSRLILNFIMFNLSKSTQSGWLAFHAFSALLTDWQQSDALHCSVLLPIHRVITCFLHFIPLGSLGLVAPRSVHFKLFHLIQSGLVRLFAFSLSFWQNSGNQMHFATWSCTHPANLFVFSQDSTSVFSRALMLLLLISIPTWTHRCCRRPVAQS